MKKILYAVAALLTLVGLARAIAPIPGPYDPANLGFYLNTLVAEINQGSPGLFVPKNILDNGNFAIAQRGTATLQTCGTTTVPSTAYSADRWGCNVNVTSGAGTLTTVTSTPSPMVGAQNSLVLYRTSATLTQPQCVMQEISTARTVLMQGQPVDFSVYLQALSGLNADNGNQANLFLFTGTGTDQGLGTFTTTVLNGSVTVATTGIITYTNTFVAGQPVYFTAATMPTGLTTNQMYYVSATNLSTSVFSVASTYAGAIAGQVIAPSSTGTTVVADTPYITPAFTGLAVYGLNGAGAGQTTAAQAWGQALNQPVTITTAWQRYQTGPVNLPANVTEAAVAICFAPTINGTPGSTDGIALADAQLEILAPTQTLASAYQPKQQDIEFDAAYRYYWQVNEPAASIGVAGTGSYLTTTTCDLQIPLPVTMRKAPTATFSQGSATTWAIMIGSTTPVVLASTWLAVDATVGSSANQVAVQATTTAETAAKACALVGAGGGAKMFVSADF